MYKAYNHPYMREVIYTKPYLQDNTVIMLLLVIMNCNGNYRVSTQITFGTTELSHNT